MCTSGANAYTRAPNSNASAANGHVATSNGDLTAPNCHVTASNGDPSASNTNTVCRNAAPANCGGDYGSRRRNTVRDLRRIYYLDTSG